MKKLMVLLSLFGLLAGLQLQAQIYVMRGTCRGVVAGANGKVRVNNKAILVYDFNYENAYIFVYGKFLGVNASRWYVGDFEEPLSPCPTTMDYNEWFYSDQSDGKRQVLHNVANFVSAFGEIAVDCSLCFFSGPLKLVNVFAPGGEDDFEVWPKTLKGSCMYHLFIEEEGWAAGCLVYNFRYNKKWNRLANDELGGNSLLLYFYLLDYLADAGYPLINEPFDP